VPPRSEFECRKRSPLINANSNNVILNDAKRSEVSRVNRDPFG
jgi:hypothetical protein